MDTPAAPALPPAPTVVPQLPLNSSNTIQQPQPQSDQLQQLKFTQFHLIGLLNAKNVASSFVKNDLQSTWTARHRLTEHDNDKLREGKRRRLLASQEQLDQAEQDGTIPPSTLKTAPAGGVRPKKEPKASKPTRNDDDDADEERVEDEEDEEEDSPLRKTLVIQPGSSYLRIGRASDFQPIVVPNVIAARRRPTADDKGKGKEDEPVQGLGLGTTLSERPRRAVNSTYLHSRSGQDASMHDWAGESDDDDEYYAGGGRQPSGGGTGADGGDGDPDDPLTLKITSIRGDLRARMRIFKLRGQGNGSAQAAAYNETVVPETEEGYNDPEAIDWVDVKAPGAKEFYVGEEALHIPNPEQVGYVVRRPYDRGSFNTTGYSSTQEFLGDLERIWTTVIEQELEIAKEELKDYSLILLIPDLYDHVYVREMTNLCLSSIGFKQLIIQQESVCATFGAGLSTACVVDIGAKMTSVTCVEEGLVLPETRMVLDFGGDDITEFLHTLLIRINFPYKDADLSRWFDFHMMDQLKERTVVLSEGDVGLNLFDFYVRRPDKPTEKYMLRTYDDPILAAYSLFAPRVVDFDKKTTPPPCELWSKEVDDIFDIGGDFLAPTNAMRNSTRHLLPPSASIVPTPILESHTPTFGDGGTSTPNPAFAQAAGGDDRSTPLPGSPHPGATKASAALIPAQPILNIRYEAGKIPLDVAVVESIVAAGTEDRMKRLCQNVLVVGGSAAIHNVGFAVETRVSPQLAARHPALHGHTAVIPTPVDPHCLAWKGVSVLPKLDSAVDLWIRKEDWENMGLRAVKERALYFA
ncbi:actin-like ATPase domain-containing protein [Meredithblackwellia eburnea MCA 4105]